MSRSPLPSSSRSSNQRDKTEDLRAGAELTNDVEPSPIPRTAIHTTNADTVARNISESPETIEPATVPSSTRTTTTEPINMPTPAATETPIVAATTTPTAATAKKHLPAVPEHPAACTGDLDLVSCESSEAEEECLLQVPVSTGHTDADQMRADDISSFDYDASGRSGARVRLSVSIIEDLSDVSDNEDSSGSNGHGVTMTALESKYVSKDQLNKFMQEAGLTN